MWRIFRLSFLLVFALSLIGVIICLAWCRILVFVKVDWLTCLSVCILREFLHEHTRSLVALDSSIALSSAS